MSARPRCDKESKCVFNVGFCVGCARSQSKVMHIKICSFQRQKKKKKGKKGGRRRRLDSADYAARVRYSTTSTIELGVRRSEICH